MKKGEITVGMIVVVIIIVISIIIIAATYYQLIKTEDLDRETCKASAVMRGTLPDGAATSQMKDLIQLKCKTKKICVTTNIWPFKGECQREFGSSEGKYSTYRISKERGKAERQIKTLLAREMADCWDMLGRGAYAIFKREITLTNSINSVGVICSRIKFDETVTEKDGGPQIKELSGFNDYLLRYKHPEMDVSYWDFLRNSYDGETMNILFGQGVAGSGSASSTNSQKKELINDFLNVKINLTTTQAIMYVEARPTTMGALIGGVASGIGGGILGAVVFRSPKATLTGFFLGGSVGWAIGDWIQLKKENIEGKFKEADYAAGVFLIDYSAEGFRRFNEEGKFTIASIG